MQVVGSTCLFWKFKHASASPETSTVPQGLATDKKAPAENPSKRKNEAMSLGTQGLRCFTHVNAGAAALSSSSRAFDSRRICSKMSGLTATILHLIYPHLSYKKLTPHVAVWAAALHTQGHSHKVPFRLQLVNDVNIKINRFFAFGVEPRTQPSRNC